MGQHWCTRTKEIVLGDVEGGWRAVKGYWDGSFNDNGIIGCGVVIKGVDRERWVTISRIAVPLKVGTTMAAEVAGVCVLTGILVLVLNKCLCVQSVNQCINSFLNKQRCYICGICKRSNMLQNTRVTVGLGNYSFTMRNTITEDMLTNTFASGDKMTGETHQPHAHGWRSVTESSWTLWHTGGSR